MDKKLNIAQIASFLALFCVFAGYYLTLTLREFLFLVSISQPIWNYPLGFIGAAIGALLCPLFLPFRKKGGLVKDGLLSAKTGKPLFVGIGFILLLTLPQIIIRSMGVEFWAGSSAALVILTISTGIFYPLSHGVFFLSGGRYKGFLLAVAIIGGVLIRYCTMPILETSEPAVVMNVLFGVIKWLLTAAALFSAICIIFLNKKETLRVPEKTNTPLIIRLIGLAVLFNIINSTVEMSLFPLRAGNAAKLEGFFIYATAAAVLLCAFFAEKSISGFFRIFIPSVIVLFILLPFMVLFGEINSPLITVMNILMAIFHFTVWAVFTAAIMKSYAGGFGFYLATASIYLTMFVSYLSPIIKRILPDTMEATIGVMLVTAAAFVLLAIRIVYPKPIQQITNHERPMQNATQTATQNATLPAAYEDIFEEHRLSNREKEVARLLLHEGLGKNEISSRLCVAPGTIKTHIINIYKKFSVNSQREFMALFVNK